MGVIFPTQRVNPARESAATTGARRRGPSAGRLMFHLAVSSGLAAACGAIFIWPAWIAADGSRQALAIQTSRNEELNDRLQVQRTLNLQLRRWQSNGRRVHLMSELSGLSRTVQEVARREASTVAAFEITGKPSPRWRGVSVRPEALAATDSVGGGEIRSCQTRLVLTGSFDSVFRTVSQLCQGTRLFLPERWDLSVKAETATAGRTLRAEIWGAVFVVDEDGDPSDLVPTKVAEPTPIPDPSADPLQGREMALAVPVSPSHSPELSAQGALR